MPSPLLSAIPYLLAAGTWCLPRGASRRDGAIGTTLAVLALAAAGRVIEAPASFHTVNNAILCGGLVLCGVALVEGWRHGHRAALVPLALALPAALGAWGALLRQGQLLVSLLAGVAGAAAVTALPMQPQAPGPIRTTAPGTAPRFARRWGMILLLSLLLVPALWLLLTVAGPGAMSLQGLREVPLSLAAETLLAALVLPATLVLAAAVPFGPVARGPRLAPIGALLLVVVVVPLASGGLEHWRSLYAGWLVASALLTAWKAQWPRVFACAGLFAIACGGGSVWWAGLSLTILASLRSLSPAMPAGAWRLASLAAAACGIAALGATLRVEVVYSVLMVLAIVIGTLRTPVTEAASG